jgi:SPX domain protein involved in polyphosphate accumulation
MKFGEQFSSHLTPEWRNQYLQYEELKEMIYETLAKLPLKEDNAEERER